LRTQGISKTYGNGETAVEALKPIDLVVKKGEFIAIEGPSGSGKSTLLHILGGLDKPTSGSVFIEGKNIFSLNENELAVFRRRKIGFIFQYYNLIPVLTAEENIKLPTLLDDKPVDIDYLKELLSLLGLSERKNHYPSALSGGQQQRVAIARALINKPAIVLADEPTGNLDKKTGREVLSLLKKSLKTYNQTMFMITHDPEVAATADRILTIEDGNIIRDKVVE